METIWVHSIPIDDSQVKATGSFTTLPVRINKRNDVADAWSQRMLDDWGRHIGDGQEHLSLISPSALGNLCSFSFPESPPERLGLVTYLCDLGLIHDGKTPLIMPQCSKTDTIGQIIPKLLTKQLPWPSTMISSPRSTSTRLLIQAIEQLASSASALRQCLSACKLTASARLRCSIDTTATGWP